MRRAILLIFLLPNVVIKNSLAILCFQCNSFYDPACSDPFNTTELDYVNCDYAVPPVNVDFKATMCRKLVQTSR